MLSEVSTYWYFWTHIPQHVSSSCYRLGLHGILLMKCERHFTIVLAWLESISLQKQRVGVYSEGKRSVDCTNYIS